MDVFAYLRSEDHNINDDRKKLRRVKRFIKK